jgi:hypothetical protein
MGENIIKLFKAMEIALTIWKVPYLHFYSETKEIPEGP